MTLVSLLYISKSLVPSPEAEAAVATIVAQASEHNATLGITGALIFTGGMFAQWLEGEEGAVGDLMARIRQDARHTDVTVVIEGRADARRFGRWSMAYAGPSMVAARALSRPLFELERGSQPRTDAIMKLMLDFTQEGGAAPAREDALVAERS